MNQTTTVTPVTPANATPVTPANTNFNAFWGNFNSALKAQKKQSTNKSSPYYLKKDFGFIWDPEVAKYKRSDAPSQLPESQLPESLQLQVLLEGSTKELVDWIAQPEQKELAQKMNFSITRAFLESLPPETVLKHIYKFLGVSEIVTSKDELRTFRTTTVHEIYPRVPETYLGCGKYISELRKLEYGKIIEQYTREPLQLQSLAAYDNKLVSTALTVAISLRALIKQNKWPAEWSWPIECPVRNICSTNCTICTYFTPNGPCDYYNEYLALLEWG